MQITTTGNADLLAIIEAKGSLVSRIAAYHAGDVKLSDDQIRMLYVSISDAYIGDGAHFCSAYRRSGYVRIIVNRGQAGPSPRGALLHLLPQLIHQLHHSPQV